MSRYGDSSSASTSSSGGGGGGGRWDANRFFRERDERLEKQPRERGPTLVAERPPPTERRRRDIDDLLRAAEERYGPPARRSGRTYNDEHLEPSSGAGALIPFQERQRERRERSPPVRPQLLRRQSSLDTFDRAANRRNAYNLYDREDYGPPVTPIAVPRRRRTPPQYEEVDFDEIRVAEPDYYGDEEFRHIRRRDRSVTPRPRGRSIPPAPSLSSVPVTADVREIRPAIAPRRGKTRMPKRTVHPRALLDAGYEYEDEGDSYLIPQALQWAEIQDLITRSREIRRTPTTTEVRDTLAVGPPRETISVERRRSVSRRPARVVESSRSRRPSVSSRTETPPRRRHRRRRSSPIRIIEPRDEVYEDVIEPRADVAVILPDRTRRSERDIQADIRALERERRALRTEREGEVDVEETLDVRPQPKAPSPRLIRAMMATLT
ncbi:hypothetical protein AJ79_05125 [Helicocarpus griseus UAMH5409]|uniref:DUF8035 domain-containing protein n=1 Tax=Helicocarpus griseus UAMH5409 TaxID=1447875 RepID=A0A2B7XGX0_9EURO|nr:hypothetical protein AJ79_05125 [Helicocarpus griseus UAMH5409]